MRYAGITYIPDSFGHPEAFLQNIRAYDPGAPLYIMSDSSKYADVIACQNPEVVAINPRFRYWVANHIFLQALLLAISMKLDRFVFIESDSRVRSDGWLRLLFEEWFSFPQTILYGTPAAYNLKKSCHAIPQIITDYAHNYFKASQTPMRVYGHWPGVHFFANGSLSGYETKTCAEIWRPFGFETDINTAARQNAPYDVQIGMALSQRYGLDLLRVFAPSSLSYSGFGEKVYSENERIAMLESGQKRAIHPVKGAYIPS